MTNKQKEDIDIVMCVAIFRCFNEQLYNIKGTHSKSLKQKFNRLIRISKSYDDEIIKSGDYEDGVDVIYDKLMDIIIELKQLITEEYEKDNSI